MITGQCLLCQKTAPLVTQSHIIPSFMYEGLFERNRMLLLRNDNGEPINFYENGFFDPNILCQKCENELLGSIERYAAQWLRNERPEITINTHTGYQGEKILTYNNLDYKKIKLFILGILWKALISQNAFFRKVYAPEHEEVLRKMLIEQDIGDDQNYRLSIFALTNYEGGLIKMLPEPAIGGNPPATGLFLINGYLFCIELTQLQAAPLFEAYPLGAGKPFSIPFLFGIHAAILLKALNINPGAIIHYTTEAFNHPLLSPPDLRQQLLKDIPPLFDLLEDFDFDWKEVSRLFHQNHLERKDTYLKLGGHLTVEVNFYDVIVKAQEDKEETAINFLHFFSELFSTIASRLDIDQKKKLRSTLYNFLTNFDHKYLNFTGELLVLNHLLHTGDYAFVSTRFPLLNGNDADFQMIHLPTGKQTIIEVLNIHFGKPVSDDDKLVEKFLTGRISQKLEKKNKGGEAVVPYVLVPVLWTSGEDLKKLSGFYKRNKIALPNVLEAVAYSTFYYENAAPKHLFGSISTLF